MSSVVQNILDRVIGDGARSSKFDCMIGFGSTELFGADTDTAMMVKTSNFPGKTHDVIDLKFKGRTIPLKGQTKYDNTWSCTFYLTETHVLKKAFEDWIESIDQVHNIKKVSKEVKKAQQLSKGAGYITNMKIIQSDFHGEEEVAIYELFNVFPKSVSAVDVDYADVGVISEFTVEFSYSHFDTIIADASEPTTVEKLLADAGDFIDELIDDFKSEIEEIDTASIADSMGF